MNEKKQSFLRRYRVDAGFQARVKLYCGTAVNVIYAVFKLVTGISYSSYWLIAIAVYYLAVSAIKLFLIGNDVHGLRRGAETNREWRVYRTSGSLLMLLDLTLSGILVQVVWQGMSWDYGGFIIFAMAAYAFYRITTAIIRLVRDRKGCSPLLRAAKAIDLSAAVIAIFSLQTAMLSSFGGGDDFAFTLNIITGIGAMAIVLGIATYMIIHSTRKLGETP